MTTTPSCPKCQSEYTYEDGNLQICSQCAHEWNIAADSPSSEQDDSSVRDAYGTILSEGDSVTVVKDLKVKGSSQVVKVGTKVKNIRLVDGADGHNISCKIEGFGAMNLKSEFVKRS
ncbi:MAG: zinc ribbon domain-containing protein YjdM [Oligoflexales bacterium]